MNAFCASENFDAFIVFLSSQPGNQTRKTLAKNGPFWWEQIMCLSQIRSAWLGTANRAMKLVHVGPAQPDQVVAP